MLKPPLREPVRGAVHSALGRADAFDPRSLFADGTSLVLDFSRQIYGTNNSAVYPGASLVLNFAYQDFRIGDVQ